MDDKFISFIIDVMLELEFLLLLLLAPRLKETAPEELDGGLKKSNPLATGDCDD